MVEYSPGYLEWLENKYKIIRGTLSPRAVRISEQLAKDFQNDKLPEKEV